MTRSSPQTFLFADLVGFTVLTEVHGDDAAADAALRFSAGATALAAEHGAQLVKSLGDAVMLRVPCAADAVRLGLSLHAELGADRGLPPIHAGAHTGGAVERAGDWFGAAVNLAARVASAARGGELLLTEATAAAAGELGDVELDSLGPQAFKNVAARVPLYSARRLARTERAAPRIRRPLVAAPAAGLVPRPAPAAVLVPSAAADAA